MPKPSAKVRLISNLRPITRDDMETLLGPARRQTITLSRVRDSHHRVAMLLASGIEIKDVARRTGYSYVRILQLRDDPSIAELTAKYREKIEAPFITEAQDDYDLSREVWRRAKRIQLDKLEAAELGEADLPLREVTAIASDGEDRFGTLKRDARISLTGGFADELEKRVAKLKDVTVAAPRASPAEPATVITVSATTGTLRRV